MKGREMGGRGEMERDGREREVKGREIGERGEGEIDGRER